VHDARPAHCSDCRVMVDSAEASACTVMMVMVIVVEDEQQNTQSTSDQYTDASNRMIHHRQHTRSGTEQWG